MIFDNSYFEDEVREGFYIPGMMKRSWAVQMEVLGVIADICKEHNIKWFAHCGTLLGAVRHGGFIPWDDDLDICMLRDDYIRFNEAALDELPEGYRLLNLDYEAEYDNFLTRITNGQSINTSIEYLKKNHGFPYVSGVDIFPLDYLMPNAELEEKRRLNAQAVWELAQAVGSGGEKRSDEEIADYVHTLTGISVRRDMELEAALLRVLETLFKEYDGKDADCVAVMSFYCKNKSHIYPLECYAKSIEIPFETGTINVPAAYDKVLKIEYGRWEAVNKRGGLHDYPVFREQEQMLIQKNGTAPYLYIAADPDRNIAEERKNHAIDADEKAGILYTIGKIHTAIHDHINRKDIISAMDMIAECQNLAIKVGNAIEKDYGNDCATVKLLEDYCEQVYNLYNRLSCEEKVNSYQEKKKMSKSINRIINSYNREAGRHREILFMPVRVKDWESLHGLYLEYMSEKDANVYVMPLPYFEREDDGNLGKEHYEYDAFPDHLRRIPYKEYDWDCKHPDVIIIQNPFDEYGSGMTVHPFFYAKNIRKYTNKLIYVQPFKIDEIGTGEEKALINVFRYVAVPGIIYSDMVYVPSENMKDVYINCLTDLMGRNRKKELEKKIVVIKPSDEIKKGRMQKENKKNVLFYAGISDLYTYKEKAIEWIHNSLELFETISHRVHVIWITENEENRNIMAACPEICNAYYETVKTFNIKGLGERMSVKDAKCILSKADAYYGSGGYVMNLCVREKIPVLCRKIKC